MDRKSYIVAIDVGSSEVVVAVGSFAGNGVINIESVVSEPTDGVVAGLVDNSKSVGQALLRARERAELEARVAITDAYVGISGKFVRCARYTDHVYVEDVDNCISLRDLNALMERMRTVKAADGEVIMDMFPLNYKGDAGSEMRNPVGCYSKQLSSTYNFILCEHMAKDRLRRVFLDAGIKICGMFANAAVVAESVVSTDEKEEGVAVVDIGGGVTDVAIYYGNVLRHMASIPIGGSAVNADIKTYGIPEKQVEKLKRKKGTAVVDGTPDEIIQMSSPGRATKNILRLNLAAVIEARMTDIAEYVWNEIRDAGFSKKLSAGIVLTGGGAALAKVAELFQRVTGQEVRVACAEMGISTESLEKVSSPSSTLAVSLLLRGAQIGPCPVGVLQIPEPVRVDEPEVPEKPEVPEPQPGPQQPKPQQPKPQSKPQSKLQSKPQTVNDRYGAAAGSVQKSTSRADAATAEATAEKPSRSGSGFDDADDDIASGSSRGGWFARIFGKVQETLDDAFRKPEDGDDGDW